MPDTDTTPSPDASAPNPFAGKSLDDLISTPPALQKGMEANLEHKITRDDAIMTRTEEAAAGHAAEMEHWSRAQGANLHDVRKWDQQAEAQKYAYEPLEAFGSFASVFAIAASLFTKAPMENALNGAAAAMNAVKAGKQEDFKHAYQAWKDNNELAIKRGQMMHEAYQEALELMKTDYTRGAALLQNSATRFGDQQALVLMENGMSKELWETINARANAVSGIAKAHEEMAKDEGIAFKMQALKSDPAFYSGSPQEKAQLYDRYFGANETGEQAAVKQLMQRQPKLNGQELIDKLADIHRMFNRDTMQETAFADWKKQHPKATAEEESAFIQTLSPRFGIGGMGGTQSLTQLQKDNPEMYASLHQMAERWIAGDHTAASAFSIRDTRRYLFQEMINTVGNEKGYTPEMIAEAGSQWQFLSRRAAALGNIAGRTMGTASQGVAEADYAIQISRDVNRGKFVPLTELQYMIQRSGSDPELAKFDAANTSLIMKYSSVAGGDTKATDALREHAKHILNSAYSHDTYEASVGVLRNEMERMVAAPDAVRMALRQGKSVHEALQDAEKEINRQIGLGDDKDNKSNKDGTIYRSKDGTVWQWTGATPPTPTTRKDKTKWKVIMPASSAVNKENP